MKQPKYKLPKGDLPRIDIMCGEITENDSLEDLRFSRNIAVRDGNLKLAMALAVAIDKKRGLY